MLSITGLRVRGVEVFLLAGGRLSSVYYWEVEGSVQRRRRRGKCAMRGRRIIPAVLSVAVAGATGGVSAVPSPAQGGAAAPATQPTTRPGPLFEPGELPSKKVLVVPIKGAIGTSTTHFVKRSITRARRDQFALILFEFDTHGGDMASMIEICKTLATLDDVPTVGYVDPYAISAGAIILAGMNHIYMHPGANVGSAALFASSPQGGVIELPERVLEKYSSFIRVTVRTLAERNGHPYLLFQAMVDQDIDLWAMPVEGRMKLGTKEDLEELKEANPTAGEIEPVAPKARLLALNSKGALRYGLASGTSTNRAELLSRLGLRGSAVEVGRIRLVDRVGRPPLGLSVVVLVALVGAFGVYLGLRVRRRLRTSWSRRDA